MDLGAGEGTKKPVDPKKRSSGLYGEHRTRNEKYEKIRRALREALPAATRIALASSGASVALTSYYNPFPRQLEQKGDTTYLTISRYEDNYAVTATFIPSDRAFRPSFPTGLIPIDEEFVKRKIVSKFEDGPKDCEALGTLIYNYFIPRQIREYIRTLVSQNLVIQTQTEHDIPWELTFDGDEYWCTKYNLGRTLGSEDQRTHPDIEKKNTAINIAVISNPDGKLGEATREANSIKTLLEKDSQIKVEIFDYKDATKYNVLDIITNQNYDVIHYAGHASIA